MNISTLFHRLGNLTDRLETRLSDAFRPEAPQADVAAGVSMIRNASLSDLRSVEFIEQKLLLCLGLNNEFVEEQPRSLAPYFGTGFGWRIWQYPNQFSKYLVSLSTANIGSYVEIGCRFGGTFALTLEYLARFNSSSPHGLAVDIIEQSKFLKEYEKLRSFEYYAIDSRDGQFARIIQDRHFDLALVDGDHSFASIMSDFKLMRRRAGRIVFHDITSKACPDVTNFWKAAKEFLNEEFEFSEFIEQYSDVPAAGPFLGIGVMRRM